MKTLFSFYIIFLFTFNSLLSQEEPRPVDSRDYSIMISAECISTPKPMIKIKWAKNELSTEYMIYRKELNQTSFSTNLLAKLDTSATEYIDTNVVVGKIYEYCIQSPSNANYYVNNKLTSFKLVATGYIATGIEIPPPENRGWVLVLVDETMMCKTCLESEIERLKNDLRNEGWGVEIKSVPRAEKFDGEKVKQVKNMIIEEYKLKNKQIKSLFLIGRVPVPFSGDINPDAHPEHKGAWPSDIYYAYVENESFWTDNKSFPFVEHQRPEIKNEPNDGKFDISLFTNANPNFSVGRVDFYNMPVFYDTTQANPEMELVRNYLNKDNLFRTNQIEIKNQGIIDDNFPASSILEGFASSGWRNMGSIIGVDNIKKADFITSLSTDSYLMAYGCGGGSYTSCGGIGDSHNFKNKPINGLITMLFGSYFGDWDYKDNFLRSPLTTNPSVLWSFWAGRPHWYLHHLAINMPMGYSMLASFINSNTYVPNIVYTSQYPQGVLYTTGNRQVHIALMGDPTIKLYNNSQLTPLNLSAVLNGNEVFLNWEKPIVNDTVLLRYNVYRSFDKYGLYEKINDSPINVTTFIDTIKYKGEIFYSVRSVLLATSNTATFYNESNGVFASVLHSDIKDNNNNDFSLNFGPNPAKNIINLTLNISNSSNYKIELFDYFGNKINDIFDGFIEFGTLNFSFTLVDKFNNKLNNGLYFVRISSKYGIYNHKLFIIN